MTPEELQREWQNTEAQLAIALEALNEIWDSLSAVMNRHGWGQWDGPYYVWNAVEIAHDAIKQVKEF